MTFLDPALFVHLELADAHKPGLLLPIDKYGAPFVIGRSEDEMVAVFVGGDYKFRTVFCKDASNWQGIFIENIEFRVDPSSAYSTGIGRGNVGSLVRNQDSLCLRAAAERGMFHHGVNVTLREGLPLDEGSQAAGFLKWKIVAPSQDEDIDLLEFDLTSAE